MIRDYFLMALSQWCSTRQCVYFYSHTARATIQFLKNNNVNFIDKEERMPKPPDAALIDFGMWAIFKRVYKSD